MGDVIHLKIDRTNQNKTKVGMVAGVALALEYFISVAPDPKAEAAIRNCLTVIEKDGKVRITEEVLTLVYSVMNSEKAISALLKRASPQKNTRRTNSQIIAILKQNESGISVAELCREHGMSQASFYKWRSKYGSH